MVYRSNNLSNDQWFWAFKKWSRLLHTFLSYLIGGLAMQQGMYNQFSACTDVHHCPYIFKYFKSSNSLIKLYSHLQKQTAYYSIAFFFIFFILFFLVLLHHSNRVLTVLFYQAVWTHICNETYHKQTAGPISANILHTCAYWQSLPANFWSKLSTSFTFIFKVRFEYSTLISSYMILS